MCPRSCSRIAQLAGIVAFSLIALAQAFALDAKVLNGHVPAAVRSSRIVGAPPGDEKLNLAIGLPLRNPDALTTFLSQLYDPASTNYHRYLTSQQFAEAFGPTESEYQGVVEFARSHHLAISAKHPNRMLLDVSGTVVEIEKAFEVNLRLHQHPEQVRLFYAPDVNPTVPADSRILHISGLDNYLVPRPAVVRRPPSSDSPKPVPQAGSGPSGAYRGNDFRGAYARGVSLNGTGQMVGLLEFDGYYAADIASYWSQANMSAVPLVNVTLDNFDGTPDANNIEVALDIEMASSMAPGLSAIIVYEGGPGGVANDILNRMATDNLAKQLSASWTFPIDATTEQIFLQLAAQGQSYFNASGDNGAYSGVVATPADNPNVTVVGGTELTTSGPGGAWRAETVWNRGGSGSILGGSGGGTSTVYSIPAWQHQVDMSANRGSRTMRNLPDVAAVAENVWVAYDNGQSESVGGTSCSSPLWAGFAALINQQAAAFGRSPVGLLNPAIYSVGVAPGYTTNFHDITSGNNTNDNSPGAYFAVAGYDLCTGWGSPLAQNLINALAPRLQAVLITNGVASILSEGCPSGGLDPGETVTINFGLKNLGAVKTTNLVATLLADDGVHWPSDPQSYGVLTAGGQAVSRSFTFTVNGACGKTLAATLQLQDGSVNLGNTVFYLPLGTPVTVLTDSFDKVTAPALPVGWTTTASNGVSAWVTSTFFHDSSPNAAFADEPASPGTEELLSPPIPITSTNAQLSFRNNFNTEADTNASIAYDGGVLEIQIGTNGFVDILSAGGSFAAGGYTRTIFNDSTTNADNPLKGRRVWGGNSGGFISTLVNLPANAAGQTIQLKWLFSLDTGNFFGGAGWYVDNIAVFDGSTCCNPSADLSISSTASPGAIAPGQLVTYSISVTNSGPSAAFGVVVSNLLVSPVAFASGSPGCSAVDGVVLCDAGTLPGGTGTNYTFSVLSTSASSLTNLSVLWGFTPDPNPSNNTSMATTTVISNAPPIVYLQPTNTVAVLGGGASFQAQAYGVAPLAYQWFFNDSPIAGETRPTLLLTNLQLEKSGAYSLRVTNVNGAATSPVAQLIVVMPLSIQISGLGSGGGGLSITFQSTVGLAYTLEYKDSLSDAAWTSILPSVNGTGLPLSLVDPNGFGSPARLYRVTFQ